MNRREAVVTATGIAAGILSHMSLTADEGNQIPGDLPWIDAHSHIWTSDTSRFKLREGVRVDQLAPRSFTDDELMAVAMPEGVGRVVLIQHYPYHGWDNGYLIDAWTRHPDRFRIVGMIDDSLPDADLRMKDLLQKGVTGFRIGPRDNKTEWLSSPGMKLMWKTSAETRQSMCCLINPSDLSSVDAMCAAYPDTPVVIDHFARIGISGNVEESDLVSLCGLARHKHTKIKISAYYALGKKQSPHHELIPMIRRLFEVFGPDRLMWASDCPYQLGQGSTYSSSIRLIRDHIDFVTKEDRRKLLCSTAETTFFFR
ncbi:MAG: amidohydrolase [Planctomycetaceae bacterium]|nr:amidohydrolase [Planctomycetaceae bacterium]